MNRRNKRYSGQKKPLSTPSIGAAIGGVASLLVMVLALLVASRTDGASANIVGGICVLAMIFSVVVCVVGTRMLRNDNFEKISRMVGVIATACWIILYCIGILIG